MANLEKTLKALANRRRLAIVGHLKTHPEATVGDLASAIKLSFRSTSKHLAVLLAADVVEREQRSLLMFYSLSTDPSRHLRRLLDLV
jgi:DNA-binding transcriptional ArsR family regulator